MGWVPVPETDVPLGIGPLEAAGPGPGPKPRNGRTARH